MGRPAAAVAALALLAVALVAGCSRALPTPDPVPLPAADPSPPAALVVHFVAPVGAPVADPFRAPPGPYAPGNRGIEYATAWGDPVFAAGPGRVRFAGLVAGDLVATVEHGGGMDTTYTHLATLAVVAGAQVDAGDPIGTADVAFHFGARRDGRYVDPASLLAAPPVVRTRLLAPP